MTTRVRSVVAMVALAWLAFACAESTAPRSRRAAPGHPPPEVETHTQIRQPAHPAAPGFDYCCGNRRFKLEIRCDERMMRCYEQRAGSWRQTYGRFCKRALNEDCYLHACDRVCDAN